MLLWLQFSKQLNYFHCKVTRTFSVTHCNCEDILATNGDSDDSTPVQKTNTVIAPDEFYIASGNITDAPVYLKKLSCFTGFPISIYSFCFYTNLLRPPAC
jgi:hypothetical protein